MSETPDTDPNAILRPPPGEIPEPPVVMPDREPQPGDGPEYHAEHAAWEERQRARPPLAETVTFGLVHMRAPDQALLEDWQKAFIEMTGAELVQARVRKTDDDRGFDLVGALVVSGLKAKADWQYVVIPKINAAMARVNGPVWLVRSDPRSHLLLS